jgi:hypothetical protein
MTVNYQIKFATKEEKALYQSIESQAKRRKTSVKNIILEALEGSVENVSEIDQIKAELHELVMNKLHKGVDPKSVAYSCFGAGIGIMRDAAKCTESKALRDITVMLAVAYEGEDE